MAIHLLLKSRKRFGPVAKMRELYARVFDVEPITQWIPAIANVKAKQLDACMITVTPHEVSTNVCRVGRVNLPKPLAIKRYAVKHHQAVHRVPV